MVFVDIAGFGDSSGEMIDLISCFTDKFLFMNAKSIRFILPMTLDQIDNTRGQKVRDLVR